MRRLLAGVVAVILVAALLPTLAVGPAAAASFPAGLSDTVVAGGLGGPTAVAMLPDGRFLVTSQDGRLWVVATNGATSVALDLMALEAVQRIRRRFARRHSRSAVRDERLDLPLLHRSDRELRAERRKSRWCQEPRVAVHDEWIDGGSRDRAHPARQHARVGREPQRRRGARRQRRHDVRQCR